MREATECRLRRPFSLLSLYSPLPGFAQHVMVEVSTFFIAFAMLFSFFLSLARRYTYSCNKNLNSILVLRHLPSRLRVLAPSLTSSSSLAIRQRTFLGGCLSKFAKTLSARNFRERKKEKGESIAWDRPEAHFLYTRKRLFVHSQHQKDYKVFLLTL